MSKSPPRMQRNVANPTSPTHAPPVTTPNKADPFSSLDDLVDQFLSGPSVRLQQNLGPLLRPPPLINEDPLQCLRTLVERRAWGDVLQVTNDLLRGVDSSYAPCYNSLLFFSESAADDITLDEAEQSSTLQQETAEIMALHCHALIKLRRYSELGKEIERWKFLPFNDGYKPLDETPEWVPWSLHIIAAETLPYTTEDPDKGADALHSIVSRIPESDDVRWKLCTYRALANAFSRKREWRMAILSLDRMLPLIEEGTKQELSTAESKSSLNAQKVLETACRVEIISVQGRYLLHAGAVAEASYMFQVARQDWNQVDASTANLEGNIIVEHTPAQISVNEGLLCFAYGNYDHSIECFRKATDTLRNFSVSPQYRSSDWVGPSVVGVAPHATLLNESVNNLAICALYTGRMAEAVTLLESLVREDPTAFLTERVAFNLCTMYELGCDTTASALKKRVLQLVAKRFFLHDVGPESFRIN